MAAGPKVRMSHTVELYTAHNGEWRWRITHLNTEITLDSSEGYKRRAAALMNLAVMTGIVLKKTKERNRGPIWVQVNLLGKIRVTV